MTQKNSNYLESLRGVCGISDLVMWARGGGRLPVTAKNRDDIIRALERILIDRTELDAYIASLKEYRERLTSKDGPNVLSEDMLDVVLDKGLHHLSDETLARLMISVRDLFLVHMELDHHDEDRLAASWLTAIENVAREFVDCTRREANGGEVLADVEPLYFEPIVDDAGRRALVLRGDEPLRREDNGGNAGFRRWKCLVAAQNAIWHLGSPDDLGGSKKLKVVVEYVPQRGITVMMDGWIAKDTPWKNRKVSWRTQDGKEMASTDEALLVLRASRPPSEGESLTFRLESPAPTDPSKQLKVEFKVSFRE